MRFRSFLTKIYVWHVSMVSNKRNWSVQLLRVAFFRSDFLQNPYFSERLKTKHLIFGDTIIFTETIFYIHSSKFFYDPIFIIYNLITYWYYLIHLLASDLAECYMTQTSLVVTWYSSTYFIISSLYLLWFVDFIGSLGKTMTCPRCRPGSKSDNLGILRRQTSLSEQPTPPTAMSFLFLPKYGSKSMLKLKNFHVN